MRIRIRTQERIFLNLNKLHCFLLLSNLLCFLNKRNSSVFIRLLFTNLFKLDPDPHLKSSWIRIHIEKNCWIRIRKKWMRIHTGYHLVDYSIIDFSSKYTTYEQRWAQVNILNLTPSRFFLFMLKVYCQRLWLAFPCLFFSLKVWTVLTINIYHIIKIQLKMLIMTVVHLQLLKQCRKL